MLSTLTTPLNLVQLPLGLGFLDHLALSAGGRLLQVEVLDGASRSAALPDELSHDLLVRTPNVGLDPEAVHLLEGDLPREVRVSSERRAGGASGSK